MNRRKDEAKNETSEGEGEMSVTMSVKCPCRNKWKMKKQPYRNVIKHGEEGKERKENK